MIQFSIKKIGIAISIMTIAILCISGLPLRATEPQNLQDTLGKVLTNYLHTTSGVRVQVKVKSIIPSQKREPAYIVLSSGVGDYPITEQVIKDMEDLAKNFLQGEKKIVFKSGGMNLKSLVTPNKMADKKNKKDKPQPPLKVEENRPFEISRGLWGRHIALSNSHGWFYEPSLNRWEFQRARLFGVVEDTYTMSYVVPFLAPMLENAGAVVLMPKERDWNSREIIVDNDRGEGFYQKDGLKPWHKGDSLGFSNPKATYIFGENPFRMGSYLETEGVKKNQESSVIAWKPTISEDGEYAVYISYYSYPKSTECARYTVKYNGGEAEFAVNQKMGGGMWVYLGSFYFTKGSEDQGVYLSNEDTKGIISADACRFGGGMGNIERGEENGEQEAFTSGMPRFMEGARYWLQWSGFADTVYSVSHNLADYTDDYVSRGKWANVLAGGSAKLPKWGADGKRIPLDLSFAFHTDAGNFLGDSIVGTLAIYTRQCEDFGGKNLYPTGGDRIEGRYLADLVQTQLVNDISDSYGFTWTRRGLWDRSYSESRTPQLPGMLLEFLSHHNFADMKFGLDPAFRFIASRAIYKGILRYISLKNNIPYVVQPLPVTNMRASIDDKGYALLNWEPREDSREETATPKGYVIYTSKDGSGYDRGVYSKRPEYRALLDSGVVYKFKVTAVNQGGESFPSEAVAVGLVAGKKDSPIVLIVNAFDRVGAPKYWQSRDSTFAGFNADYDNGVSYIRDASFIGKMYEYRRAIQWSDDDAPGFGACYNDYAGKIIAGNTFDYAFDHGKAFMSKGYSFVSSTRSAVEEGKTLMSDYEICDLIMGKQAQSNDGALTKVVSYEVYTPKMKEAIQEFCAAGRKLLLSGAYIATDLVDGYNKPDTTGFAEKVLKLKWMTHSASKDGRVSAVYNPFGFKGEYEFYTEPNSQKYSCEAPDAFIPASDKAYTIFRYPQTSISAAVAYKGEDYRIISFGFPLEVLKSQEQIDSLIGEVINFFE